jgi:hypothetical protein
MTAKATIHKGVWLQQLSPAIKLVSCYLVNSRMSLFAPRSRLSGNAQFYTLSNTSIAAALVKRTNSVMIFLLSTDQRIEGTSTHISVTNSVIFTDILPQMAGDLQTSATDLTTGTAKPAACSPAALSRNAGR